MKTNFVMVNTGRPAIEVVEHFLGSAALSGPRIAVY